MKILPAIFFAVLCSDCLGADFLSSDGFTSGVRTTLAHDSDPYANFTIQIMDQNVHEQQRLCNIFEQGKKAIVEGNLKVASAYIGMLPLKNPQYRYYQGMLLAMSPIEEKKIRGLILIISAADLGDKSAKLIVQTKNLRSHLCHMIIGKDEFTSKDSDQALMYTNGELEEEDYQLAKQSFGLPCED